MRRVYVGGIGVLVATVIAAILATNGPSPVTCDSTVTTRNALATALGTPSNAGKTVCVTQDITGAAITVTTDFASQARFVAQPNNMTVDMVAINFDGASHVTIEGFDITSGGFGFSNANASGDIAIIANYMHDYVGNGVAGFGGVTNPNVTISGNYIKCVAYPPLGDPSGPTGYGIYLDAGSPGLTITYNTVHGCGNTNDGMQLAQISNGTIANNVVEYMGWNGVGADPHADGIMIWSLSHDVTLINNRVTNGVGLLLSPDTRDMLIENNLVVGGNGRCIDAAVNGSSGDVSPVNWTFRRNTVWTCGFEALVTGNGAGGGTGNVAQENLFEDPSCPSTIWQNENGHNVTHEDSSPCWPGATNITGFTPSFADTIDYLPTNLPVGYGNVGYRRAPAGHAAYSGPR